MRTQRGCRRHGAPHRRSGLLAAVAKGEPPPATGKGIPLCAPNSPHVKTAIVGGPHVPAAWLPPASGPHRRPGLLSAVAVGEPSPAAPHCRRPPPKAYHRRPKQPARQGRYSRWPAYARSVAAAGKQPSSATWAPFRHRRDRALTGRPHCCRPLFSRRTRLSKQQGPPAQMRGGPCYHYFAACNHLVTQSAPFFAVRRGVTGQWAAAAAAPPAPLCTPFYLAVDHQTGIPQQQGEDQQFHLSYLPITSAATWYTTKVTAQAVPS